MRFRLFASLIVFALVLLAWLGRDWWLDALIGAWPEHVDTIRIANQIALAALILAAAWSLHCLAQDLLLPLIEAKGGQPLPRLLKNAVAAMIALGTIVALFIAVLGQSPVNVVLLLGALFVIVFLFFRDPLSDLVAGIAINMENALAIGDTIELPDGRHGRLVEITWRSIHLRTGDGGIVIVPNDEFSRATLVNHSGDDGSLQVEQRYVLDFGLPPERALRVLESALLGAQRRDGILSSPSPSAAAWQPGDYGHEYRLTLAYDPNRISEAEVRTELTRRVMSALGSAGLAITLPKQNLFLGEFRSLRQDWQNPAHRQSLLAGFEIFSPLEPDELARISSELRLQRVPAGEIIIRQGDTDTSMFGLAEGHLDVTVTFENEKSLQVGRILPGEFFGELPLLCGDPRSATVSAGVDSLVFEVTRESFRGVLQRRPEIAELIARVIAARQVANDAAIASERDRERALDEAANSLMDRMRKIFGMAR